MPVKPSLRWVDYKPITNVFKPIIQELKQSGKEIISVTGGDPVVHGFMNNPMNDFIINAVNDGWNMYANNSPWLSRAKKAIADFEKRMRGSDYSSDNVILTPGCANALFILHYSLLDAGDEIVALDPSHYLGMPTSYFSCFGANVVPCSTKEEHDWNPNPDEIRSKISKKTKAIFINNPNNPTGVVYEEKYLKKVVDIAGENDILIISDEIYGLIIFNGKKTSSLGAIAKDVPTVVINGISKFFMRTGWRFGYLCLHDPAEKTPELMKTIKFAADTYGHATRGLATPIIAAATMALEGSPSKESLDFVKGLEERRDYILKRIEEIEGISSVKPKGSLYAFLKIDLIPTIWKSEKEFLIDLLKEEQLLFTPGSNYGKRGFGHFRTLLMPKIEIQEEIFNRVKRLIRKSRIK